ncbi:hypothetical protein MMSR116_24140 [Methylobacterium mesophilicum SR1.6/6]|uniref:Uncharacterized protein n=1 Tax=Methylobacterium mesophilicum SR1.6/6 TaxID=908290 RepID=A0A6B9FUN4_9HYPH|nr:hypothetical protein MMSR116_24140 [Methylobacterium mesophilicum SR1.6/6]
MLRVLTGMRYPNGTAAATGSVTSEPRRQADSSSEVHQAKSGPQPAVPSPGGDAAPGRPWHRTSSPRAERRYSHLSGRSALSSPLRGGVGGGGGAEGTSRLDPEPPPSLTPPRKGEGKARFLQSVGAKPRCLNPVGARGGEGAPCASGHPQPCGT